MAESPEKTVLCRLGERRREVIYRKEDGKAELLTLTEAVRSVFSDVIAESSRLILQKKNENWEGEFLDIQEAESIPDHTVIRGVVEKPSPQQVNRTCLSIMFCTDAQPLLGCSENTCTVSTNSYEVWRSPSFILNCYMTYILIHVHNIIF